jgi:hypothetical protein
MSSKTPFALLIAVAIGIILGVAGCAKSTSTPPVTSIAPASTPPPAMTAMTSNNPGAAPAGPAISQPRPPTAVTTMGQPQSYIPSHSASNNSYTAPGALPAVVPGTAPPASESTTQPATKASAPRRPEPKQMTAVTNPIQ